MERLLKRVKQEWERLLFWGLSAVLAVILVAVLNSFRGDSPGDIRAPSAARRMPSLLNTETCYRFLEEPAPTLNSNPFEFSHSIPPRQTETAEKTAAADPQNSQPDTQTTPANERQADKPPAVKARAQQNDAVAGGNPSQKAVRQENAAAVPRPPASAGEPLPVRTVAVTFKGTFRGSCGQTVAFVKTEDSAENKSLSTPMAAGETVADLLITDVAGEQLTVRTPDGTTAAIPIGRPHQFNMP